jgi:serine/threonine protein phosphatase 1
MSTYVISDIHGCYSEFMRLLKMVKFNNEDELYILGDIIDRGMDTDKVFEWVYKRKNLNVHMCVGNHELLFCRYVDFLNSCSAVRDVMDKLGTDKLNLDKVLASKLEEDIKEKILFYVDYTEGSDILEHDKYGTIEQLTDSGHDLNYLNKMCDFFLKLPYYFELNIDGREYYLVHAFISEPVEMCDRDEMVWSRAYPCGQPGIPDKIIIYGHTPTISSFFNEQGNVITDKQGTAITVDIDCGCCWEREKSKLALVRLDNPKVFYSDFTEKEMNL